MKQRIFSFGVFLFLLNIFSISSSSQKVMKVSDSLKANSDMLEVKAGGLRVIHKYEFGPYKVVSGKAGVMTTKTNSKLLSRYSQSESTQKLSFVFVGNDIDSVLVNTFTSSKSETKNTRSLVFSRESPQLERRSDLQQGVDSFVAFISLPDDTIDWQLTSIMQYDKNSQQYHVDRTLSNGKIKIEIEEVNESDNGKQSLLWFCHGYEFFLDKKPIAAVQTMTKQFVWLHKDLNQNMKLIMAAACATMLLSPYSMLSLN